MKRMRKTSLRRRNLFRFSYLAAMASKDKKRVIKKIGRKLIKYLEVMKWVMLNSVQNKYSPPTGKMKTAKSTRLFFLFLEKKGKRMSRVMETIVRGA